MAFLHQRVGLVVVCKGRETVPIFLLFLEEVVVFGPGHVDEPAQHADDLDAHLTARAHTPTHVNTHTHTHLHTFTPSHLHLHLYTHTHDDDRDMYDMYAHTDSHTNKSILGSRLEDIGI